MCVVYATMVSMQLKTLNHKTPRNTFLEVWKGKNTEKGQKQLQKEGEQEN